MPLQVCRSVQKKHKNTQYDAEEANKPTPLLFVNKGQHNLGSDQSIEEQIAIKLHLSQRQRKRNYHKPIRFHTSTQKILKQDDGSKGIGAVLTESRLVAQLAQAQKYENRKAAEITTDEASQLSQSIGTTLLDLFVADSGRHQDSARLTFLYLQHIRPLAATVSPEWDWIGNVAEIKASEMLTDAISAYTAAFFDGIKGGAQGIVLPPFPRKEQGKHSLWELPSWFRYYNQCLTTLNQVLLDPRQGSRSDVYHTILFLLRLTILFGDGPSANMHFKALRQVARLQGKSLTSLTHEASVTQVNFVTLFLYKAAMIKTAKSQLTSDCPAYTIEPDRSQWTDQREWTKFAGMLYGRSLTWNANALNALPTHEAQQIVQRLEPSSRQLPPNVLCAVTRHYQLSLFLWSYLAGINYDPSLPKIKLHTSELEEYLRSANTSLLERFVPRILFFLCFCGVYGSRGQPVRPWFIQRLSSTTIQVDTMRDLWAEFENFTDPAHSMPVLLEEILHEMGKKDIYSGGCYRRWYGLSPIDHDPDLQAPLRIAQY